LTSDVHKNHNPNYPNVYEFTNNPNKNKLKTQKSKVKTGHRISKRHPMSQIFISKKAKWNNPFYNFVIARSGATKQSQSFRRVIASPPEASGGEAAPMSPSCHCECRCFGTKQS